MKVERVGWQGLRVGDRVLIPGAGDGLVEWTMGGHGLHLSSPPRYTVGERMAARVRASMLFPRPSKPPKPPGRANE